MSTSDRSTVSRRKAQATCAWCHQDFATIVDLLDHVDDGHLPVRPAA